jgi:hypothetical protein
VFVAWKVFGLIEYCAAYVALPVAGQRPPVEVYGTVLDLSVISDVVALTYVTGTADVETVMLQTVTPPDVTLIEMQVVVSACLPPGAVAVPDDPVPLTDVMATVQAHADVAVVTTIEAEFPADVVQLLRVGAANETEGPDAAVVPAAVEPVQVTAKLPAVNTAEPVSVAVNAVLGGVIVMAAVAGLAPTAIAAVSAATASGSTFVTYLIVRSPSSSQDVMRARSQRRVYSAFLVKANTR